MKKLIAISSLLFFVGCTDPDKAREALNSQGFSDIEITGYNFFGCSEDDTFSTGFRAKNQKGVTVTGTVCSGWFKGATIRY